MADIFKFPYVAARRVHSQKQRRSKNGTPAERAAKAAQAMKDHPPADITLGTAKPDLWCEVGLLLGKLDAKKLLPEAVKLLQVLLTKNLSPAAIVCRQRAKPRVVSNEVLQEKMEALSEYDLQFMKGYMQGLIDGRST